MFLFYFGFFCFLFPVLQEEGLGGRDGDGKRRWGILGPVGLSPCPLAADTGVMSRVAGRTGGVGAVEGCALG